ncbi:MAG TPA: type II TA system antitoxin MqsA family protein [Saprospiraceae bacterium]|nr:type II TA system antitoxin MqsA family protein [Saprospiraceae bacterium]
MKKIIECPYCVGHAQLNMNPKEIIFKKENFHVQQHYYKCDICKEEFTTTEADTISMVQVYNQYREKHGIPFPDAIALIRENYGLSAAAMSEILGLGANGYGIYERGEIPTTAIGNLISSASNPVVFKEMLLRNEDKLSPNIFKRTIENVEELIKSNLLPKPFYNKIDVESKPSSLTGYKTPAPEKVKSLFIKFIVNCNPVLNDRLKLNKMLFYADFLHYKNTGYSITGLSYRPIQYGPVPSCYDNLFALFESESVIFADWQLVNSSRPSELFFVSSPVPDDDLVDTEQEIVDQLCKQFKDTPSWDLVELSHREKAWIDLHDTKELINYQLYAFQLMGVG